MPELTQESAREIIALYRPAPRAATAAPPPLGMTPIEYFAVMASARGLAEQGFDWANWGPYQDGRISDPAFIASADTETLRRITTAHLRIDRFVGGHLEQIEREGVLDAVVDRLQTLVDHGEL
ncbi:DUF6508 domain-containing protein [Streptomyces zagrosensis]|uniref:Uncharacterized protein n=1 Tax=Streptomyces zagrosensis TaxID=1042984 RepID=A0A7W9QFZ3_9ACTN|nr:DUF6508 domain-containing protein [Streptomyces zagrosensis]MBB5939013.1 hypothetical protein [Streptomyces zagrosensis]